jgi:uncharacterized protein (TIGR02246 family)
MGPTVLPARLAAAFNDKDADAFAQLFSDDAEFVNIFGQRMRGRAGIEAGHQVVFEKLLHGSRLTIDDVDVKELGDDHALMHATWTRERLADASPATLPPGTGIFTMVARRTADGWELVGTTNVQDATPPGAPQLP